MLPVQHQVQKKKQKFDVGKLCCEMSHWYGFEINYIMGKMTLDQVMLYYENIPQEGRLQKGIQKKSDTIDKAKLRAFMGGAKVKRG